MATTHLVFPSEALPEEIDPEGVAFLEASYHLKRSVSLLEDAARQGRGSRRRTIYRDRALNAVQDFIKATCWG